VKEQIIQNINIQTLTHQTNHQQYLTLNTQHIGTIDLSSTVIYFIADNNVQVPYCCTGTPIKLHTLLLESSRAALDFKYFRHPR